MKNITLKALKSANTLSDLTNLGIGSFNGKPRYDIGHRGGHVAFYSQHVCDALGIPYDQLPGKVGVYCNYLGGGVRGALIASQYEWMTNKAKVKKVEALIEACRRAYMNAEAEAFGHDEDEWNAEATRVARNAGIESAY